MTVVQQLLKTFCIHFCVIVWSDLMVGFSTSCLTRRCLANELVAKELFSAPQSQGCSIVVNLTSIQYETLAVDTKALRFSSRIKIQMQWTDPDLAWNNKKYQFDDLMMPVDKIWTPDLTVNNAVETDVKPMYDDILVRHDGTVKHSIQMYTTVVCGINLFNYPFVLDGCPIALNGWSDKFCGLRFLYGRIDAVGENRGEWQTVSVDLIEDKLKPFRNYIYVTMSINPFNTIVTLILPSVLIMMADLVSFALPLEQGKRSTFKITLVLSFTMSLLILTEHLPDTGLCSPLIRYHFCFCLIVLVMSLLTSMVFSRISESGRFLPAMCLKSCKGKAKDEERKDIIMNDVVTVCADVTTKETSMEKIVTFLENMENANEETKRKNAYESEELL
ncbi:5-hydroxytryptamine receptor 3A-like [Trichomycterus rosablanca]|uniref:5-hydroxytryptamine receptor 3A-like n=1 Tax=Trichomycterus rosablanca TaxID=2290929 RepID=UPI002F3591D3